MIKESWEEKFDKRYRESVFTVYPDYRESHGVLLNDIKRFIASLLEQAQKDSYWKACPGCPDGHASFWKTITESDQWKAWEEEQATRFSSKDWTDCFDYDESRECGQISPAHWQSFLEFLFKNKKL